MNLQYERGNRILIELKNGEIFDGIFFSGTNSSVSVAELYQYPTKYCRRGVFNFFEAEIQSIRILKEDEDASSTTNADDTDTEIYTSHYDKIKELAFNHKYYPCVDNRFYEAMDYIKACNEISVIVFGSGYARGLRINILAICTFREVYLFDIKLMKLTGFDMGLREILEADDILKIMHDSKMLSDCFKHIYNTDLKNVADTQVSDYMLVQKQEGKFPEKLRDFADLVNIYLNLPVAIITSFEVKEIQLNERPMPNEIKLYLALKVSHLYTLYKVMDKKMLHNFNLMNQCFLNCMVQKNPEEALKLIKKNVPDKLKELNLSL